MTNESPGADEITTEVLKAGGKRITKFNTKLSSMITDNVQIVIKPIYEKVTSTFQNPTEILDPQPYMVESFLKYCLQE